MTFLIMECGGATGAGARLLDAVRSRTGVSEREADRLAYEELRAARRERGAA